MSDTPAGKRFSQVYLQRPDLLPDSARMRHRLALSVEELGDNDFREALGKTVERVHGIPLPQTRYIGQWAPVVKKMELRDVLDLITTARNSLVSYDKDRQARARVAFVAQCRKIFSEEGVRYKIDDEGGVHFTVDQAFEQNKGSTILALAGQRYSGVRLLFDEAYSALDATPPDGKSALRSSFFATESLFRLMFPSAHQLSSSEVQKHLEPMVAQLYANQKPAINLAQKLVASLKDWIDGAHFYRHEPGTEEPAQPPLELSIYMLSEAGGHLRWLAKLDEMKPAG